MPSSFNIKRFLGITALALVGIFLFFWFQIRPIIVYRGCAQQASTDARSLLKSKAELTTDKQKAQSYKALMDKNMYLRNDYESFLQKCLIQYGLPEIRLSSDNPDTMEAAGGSSSAQ